MILVLYYYIAQYIIMLYVYIIINHLFRLKPLICTGNLSLPPISHRGPDIEQDDDSDVAGPAPPPRRPPPGGEANGQPPSKQKKTPQQIAGEQVLTRILKEVEGSSFSFPEALNIASFIRKTAKKQTTRFAGHLEIGSKLKIPCKIFTKVSSLHVCVN